MDTSPSNVDRSGRRSLRSRLLIVVSTLFFCFATPSSTGGGDGGWTQLPVISVITALVTPVPSPTSTSTGTSSTGGQALLVTQSLQSDVKLQLPTVLNGATAYVSTSTGANSIMPTNEGQWVMSAAQTNAFAAAGVSRLYVAFVSPAGSQLVEIVIDAPRDSVTIKA